MFERVTCKAFFKQCNIQAGKTVLQLELDPRYMGALPMLARLAGHGVVVEIESEQQIIVVDGGTGEVSEEQASIYDEPADAAEEVVEDAQDADYVDIGDEEDETRFALVNEEE